MVVRLIESFCGGSHKQLMDFLTSKLSSLNIEHKLYSLPAKKWHWRARTSALYFAQNIEETVDENDIIFASSVLNLTELIGLRSDVARCKRKFIYFHENQLVYPVKKAKAERDFQYGYNQILTALSADRVFFNSDFNRFSFLQAINSFLKLQPDCRPNTKSIQDSIAAKSSVLYFPLTLPSFKELKTNKIEGQKTRINKPLHIVWPHRWEHDKDPETFLRVLFQLKDEGLDFHVSILGQKFEDVPEIFSEAKDRLESRIVHFGPVETRAGYFEVLQSADVVVSTALHEFYGVAMIEASAAGCYPLVPNRLVYPEIYPKENLYSTEAQLYKKLKRFCSNPNLPAQLWTAETADEVCYKFSIEAMADQYIQLLT